MCIVSELVASQPNFSREIRLSDDSTKYSKSQRIGDERTIIGFLSASHVGVLMLSLPSFCNKDDMILSELSAVRVVSSPHSLHFSCRIALSEIGVYTYSASCDGRSSAKLSLLQAMSN